MAPLQGNSSGVKGNRLGERKNGLAGVPATEPAGVSVERNIHSRGQEGAAAGPSDRNCAPFVFVDRSNDRLAFPGEAGQRLTDNSPTELRDEINRKINRYWGEIA